MTSRDHEREIGTGPDALADIHNLSLGLNMADEDVTTDAEWQDFLRRHGNWNFPDGYPSYALFPASRADVVKRFRRLLHDWEVAELGDRAATEGRVPIGLAVLAYYAVAQFPDGVAYAARSNLHFGHTAAEIYDALAVAQLHEVSKGLHEAHTPELTSILETGVEGVSQARYPAGWEVDPEAFASGLDFSVPELSAQELSLLRAWYGKYAGEVPRWVDFLAEFSPRVLKSQRNRWEHALRVLPRQCMPLIQLFIDTCRGLDEGIREALLLARGFEMRREEVLVALHYSLMYSGQAGLSIADRAGGDILRAW